MNKELLLRCKDFIETAYDPTLGDDFGYSVLKDIEAELAKPEQEPYAYEHGFLNGDGTYSIAITRGDFAKLGENKYGYTYPTKNTTKDFPVKKLYTSPQPHKPMSDAQINELYQKYGTGRLDGFSAAIKDALYSIGE
jgi:hypothetical protein